MKKILLILSALTLLFTTQKASAQLINPGFEVWSNDLLVPTAMNPNTGNNNYGWWDYNTFNSSLIGASPISMIRCIDTVHSGNYSVRLETVVYTPTSWNIYKLWGIPFIGHEYNDTLGILFNGKVNVTNQTYRPGIPFTQKLSQFKFYYQYNPTGNDTAECRVSLMNNGNYVAGGVFKTGVATGNSGWQQAVINLSYVSGLTPDTMFVLMSSSSLDSDPHAGSVLWIDDVSTVLLTDVKDVMEKENDIAIYPNPSNGFFTIQSQNDENKLQTIEIYNVLGDKIFTTHNNTTLVNIDISQFSKGVYFVKLTGGERVISKKILVQ